MGSTGLQPPIPGGQVPETKITVPKGTAVIKNRFRSVLARMCRIWYRKVGTTLKCKQ